jgi:hypothetical protein
MNTIEVSRKTFGSDGSRRQEQPLVLPQLVQT